MEAHQDLSLGGNIFCKSCIEKSRQEHCKSSVLTAIFQVKNTDKIVAKHQLKNSELFGAETYSFG